MRSSADAAEQIVQSHAPTDSADLFADAFRSQQVAYPSTRAEDTQCYAAARKVEVQLVQHARAREIDMRRCREVADDQADVARGLRLENHVGQRFILRMAGEIGIAARSGYATQECD